MKVLFVNSVLNFGSTGKIIGGLAESLRSRGHEVATIYGRYEQNHNIDSLYIGSKMSLYSHYAFSLILGRHGLHSTLETKKAINYIEKFNPQIIHLHNLHGYYINVPMLLDYLATKKSIKIVWTLHDSWLISGSSAYFDFNGIKKLYKEGIICNSTLDYPKNMFGLNQKNNIDWKNDKINKLKNITFVSPSSWLKNLFQESFLKNHDHRVIQNGIDTHQFTQRSSKKVNKSILGVANVWEKRKGLSDFIKLRELLDDSYSITLVGLTQQQINSLPEGILGIERTKNIEQLADLYSKSMYYVNPTYEDNYPTTNLEALSCGTQVLAYDTGGIKEAASIPYVVTFEKGRIEEIASYIESENEYPNFTEFDIDTLSIETFTDKSINLYEELINEN